MFTGFLNGFAILISYFVFFIFIAVLIRVFIDIPTEIFRKTLHTILLGSTFVLVYGFDTWWIAAIASLSFIVIAFPILTLGQRIPGLSKLLTERNTGELRRSMISIFSLFAFLILLCWGILGERYLVLASIFAWGFGDAAAALVGKHFGKHKLEGKMIEGKKSLEVLRCFWCHLFRCL